MVTVPDRGATLRGPTPGDGATISDRVLRVLCVAGPSPDPGEIESVLEAFVAHGAVVVFVRLAGDESGTGDEVSLELGTEADDGAGPTGVAGRAGLLLRVATSLSRLVDWVRPDVVLVVGAAGGLVARGRGGAGPVRGYVEAELCGLSLS